MTNTNTVYPKKKTLYHIIPSNSKDLSAIGSIFGTIEGAPKPIQEIASKCLRIDHVDFEVCMVILEQHVMYKHWQAFLFPSSDPRLGSCVPGEKLVQFIKNISHLYCMIYFGGGGGGTLSTDPIGLSTNLIGRSTNPIGLSTICPRYLSLAKNNSKCFKKSCAKSRDIFFHPLNLVQFYSNTINERGKNGL